MLRWGARLRTKLICVERFLVAVVVSWIRIARCLIVTTVIRVHLMWAHRVWLASFYLILDVRSALFHATWRFGTVTWNGALRVCRIPWNLQRLGRFVDILTSPAWLDFKVCATLPAHDERWCHKFWILQAPNPLHFIRRTHKGRGKLAWTLLPDFAQRCERLIVICSCLNYFVILATSRIGREVFSFWLKREWLRLI